MYVSLSLLSLSRFSFSLSCMYYFMRRSGVSIMFKKTFGTFIFLLLIMIVMSSFFVLLLLYKDTENEGKRKKTNRSLNGNIWLFIIGRQWESFRWSYLRLLLRLSSVFIIKRLSSIMTDEIKKTLSIQLILLTYLNLIFSHWGLFFHNWLITSSISRRQEY